MSTEQLALQAIVNILSDLRTLQNQPVFKEVELYSGQYDDQEGNPLWSAPAALIEFVEIIWQEEKHKLEQYGTLKFRIHIVDDCFHDSKKRRLATIHHSNVFIVCNALRQKTITFDFFPELDSNNILLNYIRRLRTYFVHPISENIITIVEFESNIVDYSLIPAYQDFLVDFIGKYHLVTNANEFNDIIN